MKKRTKILIAISSLVLIMLAIAQYYANSLAQKIIKSELNILIEEQKETYHIEIGKVNVQLLLMRFSINDIKIRTLDTIPIESNVSFDVEIDKIVVKLNGYRNVFENGVLSLKYIELEDPKIKLINKLKTDSTLTKKVDKFESDRLHKINLKALKVSNGELHYFESNPETIRLIVSSLKTNLTLTNIEFLVDQQELKDKITFDEFEINAGKTNYFDLKDHDFTLSEFHYSTLEKEIKIKGLSINNQEDISDFNAVFIENKTWKNIQATDIYVNIDQDRLKNKELFFQKIVFGNLDLTFSKNQGPNENRSLKTSELLSQIQFPFAIDTLKVKDGNVNLSFIHKGNKEIDDYSISDLFVECHFLSNDSNYIENNPAIFCEINSKLWANGRLDAQLSYHYKTLSNSAKIQLNNIPQRKLKKLIQDNDLAVYRSGIIDFLKIEYFADSTHFEGMVKANIKSVDLDYHQFPKTTSLEQLSIKLDNIHLATSFYKENDEKMDLLIDTLIIESPKMNFLESKKEILSEFTPKAEKHHQNGVLLKVNLLKINNASLTYTKENTSTPYLSIDKASITNKGLSFDFSEADNKLTSLGNYKIDLENLNLTQAPALYLTLNKTSIESKNDNIKIVGLRYKNNISKEHYHASAKDGNIWNSAYIEEISTIADLELLLKKEFIIDNIKIVRPILTHIEAIDRKVESSSKKNDFEFNFPINIKSITVINADIDFRIKTNEVKEFEVFDLTHLNGSLTNIVLNNKEAKKSIMNGTFMSDFYDLSKLKIDIKAEQGVKNPKISIQGNASSVSLLTLKNKLSLIKELNYSDGEIGKINFDLTHYKDKLSGDIKFDNVSVEKLLLSKDKNGDYLKFNIEELKLSFLKEKDKKLSITEAVIKKPAVSVHSIIKTNNSRSSSLARKDLFASENLFKAITTIEKIEVIDGELEQFSGISTENHLFTIENINLSGKKVVIYDSTNTTLPISINGLDFTMKNIALHSFPLYNLTIESIEINMASQKAYLKNLDFKNKKSQQAFFNDQNYRKAWMRLTVPSMEVDIKLKDFFAIHPRIEKMIVDKAYFKSIGNLELPVADKEKPFPNRLLAMSNFPITVDSILIKNSGIDVEFIDTGNKYGLLQFNKIDGKVSNLTTDKKAIAVNDEMKWVMDATIWESGKIHTEVIYKLGSKNDDFSMFGNVENFNLTDSDTLTKGLYSISVNSGILYHSSFELKGNNDQASGTVSFDYDELRVNLDKKKKNIKSPDEIKRVKRRDKLNESFVKSVIVNGLLSKSNMPENRNYIPIADASYDREKNKSIFHLMWYTLSSGLIEIVEAGVVKDFKNINEFFKKKKKEE